LGTLDPTLNPDLEDIAASYGEGTFLVAMQGDGIVGTGALKLHGDGSGEIVRMSVATECRRQGIGRRILDALIEDGRERGLDRIILETTETWEGAIAFYQDAGFEVTHYLDGDVYFVLRL